MASNCSGSADGAGRGVRRPPAAERLRPRGRASPRRRSICSATSTRATRLRSGSVSSPSLAGRKEEWERFDDLFEAYWQGRGRVRRRPAAPAIRLRGRGPRPVRGENHLTPSPPAGGAERARPPGAPGPDDDEAARNEAGSSRPGDRRSRGRTSATSPTPAELAEAERLAARLARAVRHRISRRYRNAPQAPRLDLRRTVRRNLGRGGRARRPRPAPAPGPPRPHRRPPRRLGLDGAVQPLLPPVREGACRNLGRIRRLPLPYQARPGHRSDARP